MHTDNFTVYSERLKYQRILCTCRPSDSQSWLIQLCLHSLISYIYTQRYNKFSLSHLIETFIVIWINLWSGAYRNTRSLQEHIFAATVAVTMRIFLSSEQIYLGGIHMLETVQCIWLTESRPGAINCFSTEHRWSYHPPPSCLPLLPTTDALGSSSSSSSHFRSPIPLPHANTWRSSDTDTQR